MPMPPPKATSESPRDRQVNHEITQIAIGYFIGAALMIVGGLVEVFLGVKAEGRSLESIAQPLTAEDDSTEPGSGEREPALA